jgi:hypothetical protein
MPAMALHKSRIIPKKKEPKVIKKRLSFPIDIIHSKKLIIKQRFNVFHTSSLSIFSALFNYQTSVKFPNSHLVKHENISVKLHQISKSK